ncbi:hypothetical protein AGMMS49546_24950 [Spirochaetia bacterium]|nr:hypothetical protein AGMMS49546_24950 [Spirochaetia bacterium]
MKKYLFLFCMAIVTGALCFAQNATLPRLAVVEFSTNITTEKTKAVSYCSTLNIPYLRSIVYETSVPNLTFHPHRLRSPRPADSPKLGHEPAH